jgi:hypothetical protein
VGKVAQNFGQNPQTPAHTSSPGRREKRGQVIHVLLPRVGIRKQNAKSRYSGIPGFEVRQNSKKIVFAQLIFKHNLISALYLSFILPE